MELKGTKKFNINWIGWYGNPEIELITKKPFNQIKINFDQRH
jgi:hypothetical protein